MERQGGGRGRCASNNFPLKVRPKSCTLETPFQTPPFLKSTPELESKHYDRFKMNKSRPSMGTSLNCRDHPIL